VKTRASESFTSELKDFVAPIDLFLAPRVDVLADVPIFCGAISASNIRVQNPSASSVYTWTTPDGHIAGTSSGINITVDAPGTYIVKQQLSAGCGMYASDTINIIYDPTCTILANTLTSFTGNIRNEITQLNWTTNANDNTEYFDVLRSADGIHFVEVSRIETRPSGSSVGRYSFTEDISSLQTPFVFYKLKIRINAKVTIYSSVLRLNLPVHKGDALLFPNPANDVVQLAMSSDKRQDLKVAVYNFSGMLIEMKMFSLKQGSNVFTMETDKWQPGSYIVQLITQNQTVHKKLVIQRTKL